MFEGIVNSAAVLFSESTSSSKVGF